MSCITKVKPSILLGQVLKQCRLYFTINQFILIVRFIFIVTNYLMIFSWWQPKWLDNYFLPFIGTISIYGFICFAGISFFSYRNLHFLLTLVEFIIVSLGYYFLPTFIADKSFFIYFLGIILSIFYYNYISGLISAVFASIGLSLGMLSRFPEGNFYDFYIRLLILLFIGLVVSLLGLKMKQTIKSVESEKDESKKQYYQLQVLLRIAKEMNGELEIDKLLFLIIQKAGELTKTPSGGIILKDNDQIYRIKATSGMPKIFLEKEISLGEGLLGGVLTEKKTIFDKHPLLDPDNDRCDLEHYRFAIASPIWWKGEILGLLFLLRGSQSNIFTKDDKLILETLSEHAACAVANAKLFKATTSLSLNDYLTGVGNLRFFYQQLDHTFAVAERYQQSFSLMIVDSDSLKQINDQFGNSQGFRHIKQLAEILKNSIRTSDLIARYDRDMFMIILPHTNLEETLNLAERIKNNIAESPIIIEGQTINTTVCIGLASYPIHANSIQSLISAVENALYQAKHLGKNQLITAKDTHS